MIAVSLLTGCSDTFSSIFGNGEIEEGEKVQFTTMVPDIPTTTRSAYSEWKAKVEAYKPVNREYTFNIEMYKEGNTTAVGSAQYKPATFEDLGIENTVTRSHDGTLELIVPKEGTNTPLYWQDNVNKWGFKATSVSSASIEADQSDQQKWLHQDKLTGYSYLPVWEGTIDGDGQGKDNFDNINYRTSKLWYADNKTAQQLSGLMVESEDKEAFKKIPLYMKHDRAWITVILKAGDGVTREQLAYENSANTINTSIFSYDGETKTEITSPWRNQAYVDYSNDKMGAAQTHASTTRYDAIVTPHNYREKPEDDIIARINLSDAKFNFAAANDYEYDDATAGTPVDAAVAHMNNYNLQAGQHLTIEATLTRASRMVLITAWVEDWTEVVTATVCDDYGQKGDPVVIKSKAELLAFLNGEKNKAGYVGIIASNNLDLDKDGIWNYTGDLNATLNVAGATLQTSKQIFNNITTSGSLVNGVIELKNNSTVPTAIANTNSGTIERITVKKAADTDNSHATIAGFVNINHGTIYYCTSNLPVMGTTGWVGGIAAQSDYNSAVDHSVMPVIDECYVNARVDGEFGVKGGGIVGNANGRITNNTFEYGITLIQGQRATDGIFDFKNIFHTAASETRAYNNAWPTKATNAVLADATQDAQKNENIYATKYGKTYNQVIDNQEELATLLNGTYNIKNNEYRIANDFSVGSTWTYGKQDDTHTSFTQDNGNMQFKLYGNNKMISLEGGQTVTRTDGRGPNEGTQTSYNTAPMLFTNIHGQVYDLTINLKENVISQPSHAVNSNSIDVYNGADAIAPLGYSVYGADALLSNVKVISTDHKGVESAMPGGLVAWALAGAKIENCVVSVPVKMWIPEQAGKDARHYAGGIVGCAGIATISLSQYTYDTDSNTLTGITTSANQDNCYYGGIVGGTARKEIDGNSEIPNLALLDNASWYSAPAIGNTCRGSIIGFAAYVAKDSNNTLYHSMADNNEGNWWNSNSKGAGFVLPTETELTAIGKRNMVMPDKK